MGRLASPANRWLPCACSVSAEICDAVKALNFRGVQGVGLAACILATAVAFAPIAMTATKPRAAWFLRTNICIFGPTHSTIPAYRSPPALHRNGRRPAITCTSAPAPRRAAR
jgi:hypothetical protein